MPHPARVASRTSFASIAAGGDHTCALDAQRAAWCWGSSHFGMLGSGQDGWDTISAVPVKVIAK